jgi:uroporphyrinogen-III decarboxylase
MSQKEIIAKLVRQYIQIQSIEEEVKEIKAQAKQEGYNVSILGNVAKAIANNKVDELKDKSEQTMEAIQEARS